MQKRKEQFEIDFTNFIQEKKKLSQRALPSHLVEGCKWNDVSMLSHGATCNEPIMSLFRLYY